MDFNRNILGTFIKPSENYQKYLNIWLPVFKDLEDRDPYPAGHPKSKGQKWWESRIEAVRVPLSVNANSEFKIWLQAKNDAKVIAAKEFDTRLNQKECK